MRITAAVALLMTVLVGASLVVAQGGWLATGYAIGVAILVVVLLLREVVSWLPPPAPARPLYRLASRRRVEAPTRPAVLVEWEAALIAARIDGWAAKTIGARLAPLVDTHLR